MFRSVHFTPLPAKLMFIGAALLLHPALPAQGLPEELFPKEQQQGPDPIGDATTQLTDEQAAEIDDWIGALGSNEFAARERAASRLAEIGLSALPQLRRVAAESSDPEVRLRAEQIVQQLTSGDLQSRIEAFLAGDDVDFGGWRVTQAILGDSPGIRELFVELLRGHPDVPASLEGTPRDRAMAMEGVVTKVQTAMQVERKFPTKVDAFALLLPAVDSNVPLNASFESLVLTVLQTESASIIQQDAQLQGPFRGLLGRWIIRSTLSSREDALLEGMRWDISATLPLALQTLGEATQTETLGIALQAIARFGSRDQIEAVVPLLDDPRPCAEPDFSGGKLAQTQLGDAAMATIAILGKVPLSEAGFGGVQTHPTYGFILTEVGFPLDDPAGRKAARAKIGKLLDDSPAPEGS